MTNFEVYENLIKKSKAEAHCVVYKLRTGEKECKAKHRGCTRKGMLDNFDWLFEEFNEEDMNLDVDVSKLKGCNLPIATWLKEEYKNRCSGCPNLSYSGKQWKCDILEEPCNKIYPCPEGKGKVSWFIERIHENELELVERGYSEEEAREIAEKCKDIMSML